MNLADADKLLTELDGSPESVQLHHGELERLVASCPNGQIHAGTTSRCPFARGGMPFTPLQIFSLPATTFRRTTKKSTILKILCGSSGSFADC